MHNAYTVWLTGLSQAGKSTLADVIEEDIEINWRKPCVIIGGDEVRAAIPPHLQGFDAESISRHLRYLAFAAKMLNKKGVNAIVDCISPLTDVRTACKEIIGPEKFFLVYVATPLEVCKVEDKKGIYTRTDVRNLAGVDAPFDPMGDQNATVLTWHDKTREEWLKEVRQFVRGMILSEY